MTNYTQNSVSSMLPEALAELKVALKAARPAWVNQELRSVLYHGIVIPDYKVAQDGLIMSYKRKNPKPLEWCMRSKANHYPCVCLVIPTELLTHVNIENKSHYKTGKKFTRTIDVHTLVAEAWVDIEDNCPRHLEPWWPSLPLELKKELRQYFNIDHIDNNKFNAHVSNLRFVSMRDNNYSRKVIELGVDPKEKLEVQTKIDMLMKEQRRKSG